jgi:hypothetical protein
VADKLISIILRITALLLSILLTSVGSVNAETWVKISETPQTEIFYDSDRVMGESKKLVWLKVELKDGSMGFLSMLYRSELDCAVGQIRTLEAASYQQPSLTGRIFVRTSSATNWVDTSRVLWSEILQKLICN